MKKGVHFGLLLCLAALLLPVAAYAEEGAVIFSDDFSKGMSDANWKLDSTKSWKVDGGVIEVANYGAGATVKVDAADPYVVQVRVKYIEAQPNMPGGFAGVNIQGINFVIRSDGFWWPYRRPGATTSLGSLKKAEIVPGKWYEFKIIRGEGGSFEWYVDGQKICSLQEPDMKGSVLSFGAYRTKSAYDDVKITKLK
jgi:hypothetical protein